MRKHHGPAPTPLPFAHPARKPLRIAIVVAAATTVAGLAWLLVPRHAQDGERKVETVAVPEELVTVGVKDPMALAPAKLKVFDPL